MDSRTDRLQGALTETLGFALAGLRQHDNALGQGRPNGVVAPRSSAERAQRHLKRKTHLTDCFAVKLSAVEVVSNGHGKQKKWLWLSLKFHSTKLRSEKSQSDATGNFVRRSNLIWRAMGMCSCPIWKKDKRS